MVKHTIHEKIDLLLFYVFTSLFHKYVCNALFGSSKNGKQ